MQNAILTTTIDLVLEQVDESTSSASIHEAIGVISMQLQSLCIELSKPPGDQDADALLQILVQIAGSAVSAAATHVLPIIEEESR
jgi:hypothetical protein